MTDNVYWMLKLQVAADQLEAFKALGAEMSAATEAAEEGAVAYEWHLAEEGSCHLFERYADSAAAMTHLGNFMAFAERFMALATPLSFEVYGAASDELKEAMASFGAQFHEQFAGFAR